MFFYSSSILQHLKMNISLFPLQKSKFCFEQMAEDFWGVCRRVAGGGGENNFEWVSNYPCGWPKCVWRQVSDMQTDEKALIKWCQAVRLSGEQLDKYVMRLLQMWTGNSLSVKPCWNLMIWTNLRSVRRPCYTYTWYNNTGCLGDCLVLII